MINWLCSAQVLCPFSGCGTCSNFSSIGWAVGDMWGVLLLGGLMRLILSHHVTFFINSLCHMWGSRPYMTKTPRVTTFG